MLSSSVVVIAQNNASVAARLANDLHPHFAQVTVTESITELRTFLEHQDAQVAVLDMEVITLEEVRQLACTFKDLNIVCTHRSPDERMWMAALKAGAIECCHHADIHSILRVSRNPTKRRTA